MQRAVGVLGTGALLALVPITGHADTPDTRFLITTSAQTNDGTSTFRDVVILRGDGSSGEVIGSSSNDAVRALRDRSCYGVIASIARQENTAHAAPIRIGVILDPEHIVPVPLTAAVDEPAAGARLIEANGDASSTIAGAGTAVSIGIRVDSRILAQNGQLQAATFRQVTYLSDGGTPVDVSACAVQRVPPALAPA